MKRTAIALIASTVVAAGVITAAELAWQGEECFQYDVSVESYVICGTPEHIEDEQRARGKEMAESAVGFLDNPVASCKSRAFAQAEMFDWPERYRTAYIEGCQSAVIPKVAIGKDSNITPSWEEKRAILQAAVEKFCQEERRCTK